MKGNVKIKEAKKPNKPEVIKLQNKLSKQVVASPVLDVFNQVWMTLCSNQNRCVTNRSKSAQPGREVWKC